ncbi:LysR family transcriptional regulator [Oceanobacter kriegii]|uniref:LysR family transcriptional regulator n=1 Tax=Oceanobacter kriegii TaxID=64972 RepID=UPI00040E0526|nr:LysR family transcriptional regulator [Oceanobacter kriegii]
MLQHLIAHLPYFSAVARHRSFSAAADELAVSQSSVSYQINKLEGKLGARLLLRGKGNRVQLTPRGEQLFDDYRLMEKRLQQSLQDFHPGSTQVRLSVTAPVDFGVKVLCPLLPALEAAGLELQLTLTDELVSLQHSQHHLAIRNRCDDPELQYLGCGRFANHLIAPISNDSSSSDIPSNDSSDLTLNELLQQPQPPTLVVRDLNHSKTWTAAFDGDLNRWQGIPNKRLVSNTFGILEAVKAGVGIGIVPAYFLTQTERQWVQLVSTTTALPETEFHIAYQESGTARRWAQRLATVIRQHFGGSEAQA